MSMTTSTSSGISQRTNVWAAREMLKHAGPVTVLEKFGKAIRMPKNKSTTAKFRRPKVFAAVTTPLVEGVTPTTTAFQYEDVSTNLSQYGMVVGITDVIEDTHEDPVLQDATLQTGENLGRTIEALTYGTVKAGTSVFYANGTTRSGVNTAITLNKQRAVTRYLKGQKAKKITRMLSGSPDYSTSPIEAAYIAVGHTDCEADIRGLAGFTPVAEYGQRKPLCEEEIGSVEDVRYILSADLDPFLAAGSGTLNGMVAADSTNVDVYPILFFGMDAYGVVAIRGQGAVSPTVIPVGQKTKDDPLGQRGYVGWKTWFASLILNQTWMARLEVGVTSL
ncbi:N4-gp56 family major capsid protein [Phaeobacter gallaeciensis]|uniref:N4-gp56 family major capsid protein n=1 Tax=Phaeobacter gallaeciensis TaxID=60890 RepID=UPI00237F0110|nr:N4-gp56 family major capsid protein [Phaeobacter gallaeciensis]MDE4303623.1 N4-gp56 family major capsid protein [Phaeobacter gallaeciensis]MDE4307895.1 N4-gp56 family major capsid protein [Phaeobacter gallaeciensis]MDE4312353.1 N4-gp56 family major capsid protein [Phaeobacter gallaeciensis]MDE4316824.1 N4-gp56 family major capsid protein [Phaeobacter gallaeciensis]MDE4321287.1 N4-gp56 family major capsid protein [Phaeobacter gallaeciensis]